VTVIEVGAERKQLYLDSRAGKGTSKELYQ